MEAEEIALGKMRIFRGLAPGEPEAFIRREGGRMQQFGKKTRLSYRRGDNADLGIIADGTVQIILDDRNGREVLAYELRTGAVFGNVWTAIGKKLCSAMSLDIRAGTTILWLPPQGFLADAPDTGEDEWTARVRGVVRQNMLAIFSRMMFVMIQKIEVLSQHTLRERLRLHLLQQANEQGTDRVRIPSRMELAKALECNRSALAREIGHMEDEGLLLCGDNWMELKKESR